MQNTKQLFAVSISAGTVTALCMWGFFFQSENENTIRELQASIQQEIQKSDAAKETFQLILDNPTLGYTVHEGDTVTSISVRFYGTSTPPDLFLQANNLNINSKLKVGEVLLMSEVPDITVIDQVKNISTEVLPSSKSLE